MVLVKELTREEIERHSTLIREYGSTTMGTDKVDIEYLGNGLEKGVYRVRFNESDFLAAAALRARHQSLLPEYNILHGLYRAAPERFPRPIAHYSSPFSDETEDLMIMEMLPHVDLRVFRQENALVPNLQRTLAYEIGKAVAQVQRTTGRYSSEPHDGNILARFDNGRIDIKFVDAIQFKVGDLETAVRAILLNRDERPECFRFIPRFRDGLVEDMETNAGIPHEDAVRQLRFMAEYNPIL